MFVLSVLIILFNFLFMFPQDKNHLTAISSFQKDIISSLPNSYYTFVDVMEFRDTSIEVITSLATSQFFFDIVSQFF